MIRNKEGTTGMKETIYILDDQPQSILTLRVYLERQGFQVTMFTDPEIFLKDVASALPDLLLLDVMMPKINGYEVCRRLKADEHTAHIPVIFLTAKTHEDDILEGFEAGSVDYIMKPFQHKEVMARISTHLTLQRQNRQLVDLNRSKDEFFSILTHHLQRPFNALFGYSHCLNDCLRLDAKQERIMHFAQQIQLTSEGFYTVLENLLLWSQIRQGSLEYAPATLCIDALLRLAAQQFQFQADYKQITMQVESPSEVLLQADEAMLRVILRNLLSNALTYTPNGGNVTLRLTVEEPSVRLVVSDTGPGFPQEIMTSVLQEEMTIERPSEAHGVGIGLLLCKALVNTHHGILEIENQHEHGTRVSITLPKGETP